MSRPGSVPKTPVVRWLTTLDHRDIGVMYVVFGAVAGVWGATDAMAVRTELLSPGLAVWDAATYNAFFTTHGLTMLFFFATPVALGLANYAVPLLVRADDMAFPRVNAVAFWLLPPALLLARAGIVGQLLGIPDLAPPATGWTFYAPLATQQAGHGVDLVLLGLHLGGVSTIASSVNLVVTIAVVRDDSVSWASLDIFSWTMLTTAGLVLFAFPVLGSAMVMLLADRNFGTTFFAVDAGPVLWQHLFWFFGHPEVYILVLPAMGIVSHVLPQFAGRKLFGFRAVVYSTLAIGVLSFGVWAHHMFATGLDPRLRASFMAVTLAIAAPSAVKTFNWIATLWNGAIRLTAPMLFCVAAVGNFVIGGVTGVFLASIPVDLVLHDTYYVVGHFHFLLVGTIVFGLFAGGYYWFPLLTGRWFDRGLARAHFYLSAVGVPATFLPFLLVGMGGLPRRVAAYPPEFAPLHYVATLGAYVLGVGQLVFVWNALASAVAGDPVDTTDPWELGRTGQRTPEWEPGADR
ncbi:cbb3-type cytochrome c oxidase subunit I [Haloprofundus salinisoli]|uniref:cbb3-type cytochrome c oxidase subunit I n=1 Tax=Haloprofundus salinisoli TaxID=2876193 RepID=UPI001CCA2AB1|nr:cbb3-type cytochrome c oxidase subunit I [Haloprofundus salinisoli]